LKTDSAIAQGGTTDYNLLQRCYIGWNIAGGTTSDSLQKEYEWAVYLSLPIGNGESTYNDKWDDTAEIDYNRYLRDFFEEDEPEDEYYVYYY